MSEEQFLQAVIQAAQWYRVLAYHTRDSRRSEPGFPDLVLVGGRVEFWELKSERGTLTAAQKEWHRRLRLAGEYVAVFRPEDWKSIEYRLRQLGNGHR